MEAEITGAARTRDSPVRSPIPHSVAGRKAPIQYECGGSSHLDCHDEEFEHGSHRSLHRIGGPDVLQIDNFEVPPLGAGEVRIRVKRRWD